MKRPSPRRRPLSVTRKIWQIGFLSLFFFLLAMTWFPRSQSFPVDLFMRLDPLASLGVALSARFLPKALLWSLAVLLSTVLLGRAFCSWVCPLGTLHEAMDWLLNLGKKREDRLRLHRPCLGIKVPLLVFLLGMAFWGALETGLFSPLSLLTRSVAAGLWPALAAGFPDLTVTPPVFKGAWLLGAVLVALLLLNAVRPRFWCRVLCPLGAWLGICSRFSLWGVERNEETCVHCGRCAEVCAGACEPDQILLKSECLLCLRCRDVCPVSAMEAKWFPSPSAQRTRPDAQRRHVILALVSGALAGPLLKASGRTTLLRSDALIRPPGALDEESFLARCLQCGLCMKVCPNNALQPSLGLSGAQGLFSPVLVPRVGYCEIECTSCGEVCPSQAIRKLSLEERTGPDRVRCGTAFFDKSRCLPWAWDIPCGVCQEVCPVSPKAILPVEVSVSREGETVTIKRYTVDPARCVGCGACENACPIKGQAGIRVSAVGESRHPSQSLLL